MLSKSRLAFRGYLRWVRLPRAISPALSGSAAARGYGPSTWARTWRAASVWLTTVEWRLPIWREIEHDVGDHIFHFAIFTGRFLDVGESYLKTAGAPSFMGRASAPRRRVLFAFLGRATLRSTSPSPSASWRPGDLIRAEPGLLRQPHESQHIATQPSLVYLHYQRGARNRDLPRRLGEMVVYVKGRFHEDEDN